MFCFLCLSLTPFILNTAEGTAKLQIACLQIQDGHCNTSLYRQNICSKAAANPDLRIKGSSYRNSSDSRIKGSSYRNSSDSRIKAPRQPKKSDSVNEGSRDTNSNWNHVHSGHDKAVTRNKIDTNNLIIQKAYKDGFDLLSGFRENKESLKPRSDGSFFEKPQRYKFMLTRLSWNQAQRNCSGDGGWLAKLDQPYKWNYLKEHSAMLKPQGFWGYMWMGLQYNPRRRKFFWTDGSSFQDKYMRWKYGEPSHTFGGTPENCVAFTTSLSMNDRQCSKRSSFLCEYEPPNA